MCYYTNIAQHTTKQAQKKTKNNLKKVLDKLCRGAIIKT
jgi:hypothetical protein